MGITFEHSDTVAGSLRFGFKLLTMLNSKTPKGEKFGYLTGALYLAPHTEAGGKTVCSHSTEACREGCLFTAGRGLWPRIYNARVERTRFYHRDRVGFLTTLVGELERVQTAADGAGLTLAIRLNAVSDIMWEKETLQHQTLFDRFGRARWYDFTRIPHQHRRVPKGWHLTYSLADDELELAVAHLRAGRNVAAVFPLTEHLPHGSTIQLGDLTVHMVDGEQSDLRFLDPSPAIVQLKPKGRLLRGNSPMVHPGLIGELMKMGHAA